MPEDRLSPTAVFRLVVLGIVLWAAAVVFIRWAAPLGVLRGGWRIAVYALTWPATWPCVPLVARLAGAPRSGAPGWGAVAPVAVVAGTALFLDGAALAWSPGLYSADPRLALGGAAWLLWAVGVALALALFAPVRPPQSASAG